MLGSKYLMVSAMLAVLVLFTGTYVFVDREGLDSKGEVALPGLAAGSEPRAAVPAIDKKAIAENYGKLPMQFEPNVGQTDDQVKFIARGNNYSLFLTGDEAVLSLRKIDDKKPAAEAVVRMRVEGADPSARSEGLDASSSRTNYFIGSDPSNWYADVPNYAKVKYNEVLPGIDTVYYGNGQQLEYDFIVRSGSDPNSIKLKFDGIKAAKVDAKSGDLVLETGAGEIRQLKPVVYQNNEEGRAEIAAAYHVDESDNDLTVSFKIADYDLNKDLVIDPILAYGSYLGGGAFDEGRSIAVDASGNAHVVGTAASLNFPTTAGVIKTQNLPATNNVQWYDAFVSKVNPEGTALVFSTYFGGRNGSESGGGVAVDPAGNVVVSGTTTAGDLPVVNAYQSTFGGTDDGFALKLNPTGSAIIYSTYLGGNNTDSGGRVAINQTTGDTVFTGYASSGNFPTTPGAYKERLCDGTPGSCNGIFYSGSYLVKLTASGGIVYSTLFTAAIADVVLDSADNATFGGGVSTGLATTPGAFQPATSGGGDGFVAKMNPSGNALVLATYLGGGLQSDFVSGITLDADQNIYVTGQTENVGFPATAGAYDQTFNGNHDGFVTKFNPGATALIYSTFLGGNGKDEPKAIGLGVNNEVFVTGETLGPLTFPLKNSLNGTFGTVFLTRLNSDASALVFSTLLGQGGAYDIAVDSASNAYITGHTTQGVITSPNAFQPIRNRDLANISSKDGFVLKLAPMDESVTTYSISGMVTDQNYGFNNDYKQIVVTVTGSVNRSITIPYNGGFYFFGALPAGGTYTVTVSKLGYVTDPENVVFTNLGANQSADFTILRNHEPVAVITSPAHGTTFNAPATINIEATATDEDGDAIQRVEFVAYSSSTGNVPLGIDTTAPYQFTWTNVPVNTWSINAYPVDSKGLRGISTPTVHVFVVDAAPLSVSFISPTEGQTVTEGGYLPISVSVSSSVTQVEVRDQNNEIVAWMTGPPWSTTRRMMEVGQHTFTATARNALGDTVTAGPVTVNVVPINHLITGIVRNNISFNGVPNVTINLVSTTNPSITASTTTDANGNYSFTGLGTTPNDGVTITPQLADHTFDPPNRNIVYLGYVEWDNQNFIATAQNTIDVAVTSPTNGQTFPAPASFTLAASASSQAGTITQVELCRRNNNGSTTVLSTDIEAPYEMPVTNLAAGTYRYVARATDSTGAVRESEVVSITVNAAPTTIRLQGDITSPGGNWMPGVTVLLTGTVNGQPINQTSVSNFFGAYGFFNLPAGGNYTITPQGTAITFTPPSQTFLNAIEDNLDVDFEASAQNTAPSVTITSPTEGAVFNMPASIPVSATASDPDGTIVRLRLTAVSATQSFTIGETLGGTFNALWQPNVPGTYTIWASALDNGGLQTSTSLQITVNPPAPVSISGRAVDRASVGIEGATVELRLYNGEEEPVVASATTDASGSYSLTNIPTFAHYVLRVSNPDYTFSPHQRLYFNLNQTLAGVDFTGTMFTQVSDFDGDRGTDVSVWRPATGIWYVNRSQDNGYTSAQFGGAAFGDIVTPGNYDGDRKIDYSVYRNGTWFILNSSTGAATIEQFGLADDKPVPADYDGDGRSDIAVWRPSNGVWYIHRSSDNSYDYKHFGMNGDMPVAGDFDGDGMVDQAVFRPSTGTWYILQSSDGSMVASVFGTQGDMPIAGDFDGDKRADITVFRPSNGFWYVMQSTNGTPTYTQWGAAGDMPVPGDYDRDGKTDHAVFRPSSGTWYVILSSSGRFQIRQFGVEGDIPIPSAYVH